MGAQLDTRPDLRIAQLAGIQWGVVSAAELRRCGLTKRAISVRIRKGRLHPIHRGVYAVGHRALSRESLFVAALKACGPSAVLSHFTAAVQWGFAEWDGRFPEVTVPATGLRQHSGINVHRTKALVAGDVCTEGAIRVTSPARTLVDLAGQLDDRRLRRVVRQAQSLRRCDLRDLAKAIARAGRKRGVRRLGAILAAGPAPTRSFLEDLVLDLIVDGGFARPDVNVPLALGGRTVIPDFRWPQQRLVLEADGAAWHADRLAREDDGERQALLEAHGERVLRVTWNQATARPREVLARLRGAGVPRR